MPRWFYFLLACLCLALGAIGIFLPGLPTTPFVLVAAWAAARGHEPLHRWIRQHRVFGPLVRNWQQQGAVSPRAKRAAALTMSACGVIAFFTLPSWWMAALSCAFMLVVGAWLWSRPEPRDHPANIPNG